MKITLLHPSRGRAVKAHETFLFWVTAMSEEINFEHILSLDETDPELPEYEKIFNVFTFLNTKLIISNNTNVVEATNAAAKHATGDILIYLSDDFKCPVNWNDLIIKHFTYSLPTLLKVNDCLQKFHVAVLTIPIMNRALYEKLGYFWHPEYKSMFVDEDLYWTCKNNNWLIEAPELLFPHEHCCIGKAERDETYIRSEANWNQGKEVFAQRKLKNFPL